MAISKLIEEWEMCLRALRAPVLTFLEPPVSDEELHNFLTNLYGEYAYIEDLAKLYRWHNGTDFKKEYENKTSCTVSLFVEFNFNSLYEIARIIQGIDDVFLFKEKKMLPFFANYSGQFLAIDISLGETNGGIYFVQLFPELPDIYVLMFDSIENMFQTFIECHHAGILYYENDEECIDISDFEKYYEIGQKINPHSPYWAFYR